MRLMHGKNRRRERNRDDGRGRFWQTMSGLVLGGLLFTACSAFAFPLTSQKNWEPSYRMELIGDVFPTEGISALSNCSASFIRFKNSDEDARGLILTNGHCIGGTFGGMPKPGEVVYRKSKKFQVKILDKGGAPIATLKAERILYGTMTDTDLALLELNQSYRDIFRSIGVAPLVLADQRPSSHIAIEVPSGYWTRTYRCVLEDFVHILKEENWVFKDSIRYGATGCEVIGGTSGSPILSAISGEIIGINNTGNEAGRRCTMNNPCEVDENGKVQVLRGRGYGQQTYHIYSCLDPKGAFDLSLDTCSLPGGSGHVNSLHGVRRASLPSSVER